MSAFGFFSFSFFISFFFKKKHENSIYYTYERQSNHLQWWFFFYLLINSAILSKESNNFQSIVGAISCFFLSFAKFLFPFHKYRQWRTHHTHTPNFRPIATGWFLQNFKTFFFKSNKVPCLHKSLTAVSLAVNWELRKIPFQLFRH